MSFSQVFSRILDQVFAKPQVGHSRRHKRRMPRTALVSQTEQLESRQLLTSITASVAGDVLTINGSDGNDTIVVSETRTLDVHTTDATGKTQLRKFDRNSVNTIVVKGHGGADLIDLSGVSKPTVIGGGGGNDTLRGGNDIDVVYGDAGNDFLKGNDGNDRLYGGNDRDIVHGDDGVDVLKGEEGNDELYGGEGDDYIYGDAGNDLLKGDSGDDRLYGGDDRDAIYGDDGIDVIKGGAENDKLYGGEGDDYI